MSLGFPQHLSTERSESQQGLEAEWGCGCHSLSRGFRTLAFDRRRALPPLRWLSVVLFRSHRAEGDLYLPPSFPAYAIRQASQGSSRDPSGGRWVPIASAVPMRGQVASYLPCVALGLGRDSGKGAGREQARIGTVAKPSIPAAWLVRLAQDRRARELGAPWAGRVPACLCSLSARLSTRWH